MTQKKPIKSEIEHNNTKPGLCRKGGSWTVDKAGKSVKKEIKKPVEKETKKPVTDEGDK